jgi:hypothetical protein
MLQAVINQIRGDNRVRPSDVRDMRKIFFGVIGLLLFISPQAYACPACVDSALFYFYPFMDYWFVLLIFWLLGRCIFNIIARRMNIALPRLSPLWWLFLLLLSYLFLIPGGLFPLFTYVIFPSWLISYILCFVKSWKLRSQHLLYKRFIFFQVAILVVFVLIIPLSYILPRKVPFNVRVNQDSGVMH